jgi:hypothetical protein
MLIKDKKHVYLFNADTRTIYIIKDSAIECGDHSSVM